LHLKKGECLPKIGFTEIIGTMGEFRFLRRIFWVWLLFTAAACGTKVVREPFVAMKSGGPSDFTDDLNFSGLRESLTDHIRHFKARPSLLKSELQFGARAVPASVYVDALARLADQLPKDPKRIDTVKTASYLKENFECLQVHGDGRWGEAFITSYFDPVIPAAKVPTEKLYRPVYGVPDDMVLIQLDEFRSVFPHWSIFQVTEQKSAGPVARGRLYKRRGVQHVVPYYSRFELDRLGLLRSKPFEIAYADPIDVFVMQIQGSGTLEFEDGSKLRVGYAAQNGHPYVPIGKFLKDRIPAGEMSLQAIERVARTLPADELQELLDKNPSYVFFTKLSGEPLTTLGTPVRPGRTIATDRQFFPKGALAFVQFQKPVFTSVESERPQAWENVGRLVMDQDTGGAIRGSGRLDLYWGRGAEAKQAAGVMKQWGKLCYLVPRS